MVISADQPKPSMIVHKLKFNYAYSLPPLAMSVGLLFQGAFCQSQKFMTIEIVLMQGCKLAVGM